MTETFEEMLEELRAIVRKLEDGDGSLEESIAMYEGALLVKRCEDLLSEAELKLTELGRDR
jgi:exodeoxyribonuclease VII small subunit